MQKYSLQWKVNEEVEYGQEEPGGKEHKLLFCPCSASWGAM